MIQPERYAYQDFIEALIVCIIIFAAAVVFVILNQTPSPESTVTVIENVSQPEVYTPTPTPEPTLSEAQYMEMYGGLNSGEWLSWQRDNVSGLKDMNTHVTVWGYREEGVVKFWSVLWGRYFTEGAGEGNKFLFVYAASYSDDNSSRMWGIQPSQFSLDVNGKIYQQSDRIPPEIRMEDFTNTYDYNHVAELGPYGYARMYDSKGYEIAEPLGFLKAGKSNMWSGYIVFVVPRDTKVEDVKVLGNFHNLAASHWWKLA